MPNQNDHISCTVSLLKVGELKLETVKILKDFLNIGLAEAKNLVENAPSTIQAKITKDSTETFKEKLEELGTEVEISF